MGESAGGKSGGSRLADHLGIGVLTRTVPRYIVDEVLAETGRTEKRVRLLPAHLVVYFVMAMALFRDGYDEVIRYLVHGLRFARTWSSSWTVPTTGAISQARKRLGEAPMKAIYSRVALPLASPGTPGAWFGRYRLMAIDGVMIDIPDTAANIVDYPRAVGGTRRPYPQVKIASLAECGSHAILDATIGSIGVGERELADPLTRSLDEDMLVLADRGFYSYPLWLSYRLTGAQLLWRLSKTTILPVRQTLPDGSFLSEITKIKGRGKTRIPIDLIADPHLATHIPVRVIEYQITDPHDPTQTEDYRLITTILDPAGADAHDLAQLYRERWELELSFREVECQLLHHGRTLRSQSPEMIRQEIWGLLLTHYAVRAFMLEAADTIDIDPDRISTIRAINIIRRTVTDRPEFSPHSQKSTP